MKINVSVKTRAHTPSVEKVSEQEYVVRVSEVPAEGAANKAVIAILAEYFDVPKSTISIYAGYRSNRKVIEIRTSE